MIEERYELAVNRIKEINKELEVAEAFRDYFNTVSEYICVILAPKETSEYNKIIYEDIIGEQYEKSYANPEYCASKWRELTTTVNKKYTEKPCKMGVSEELDGTGNELFNNRIIALKYNISQMLCFIYSEIRGLIPYIYEQNYYASFPNNDNYVKNARACKEIITIYLELFIEVYVLFQSTYCEERDKDVKAADNGGIPKTSELHEIIYWFISDNCDIISPFRIRCQIDPSLDFATNIIMNSNLEGTENYFPEYLYKYGEYITENEISVAKFLAKMPQSEIDAMASTYTEGYRIGFVKAGKPLDKKNTVNIRYNLGFERVIKAAISNFKEMGLNPVIYRAGTLSLVKSGVNRIGYTGATPNKQYDYDHREDVALYFDKEFINRKSLVIKKTYEEMKDMAAGFAGPAVMEVFGEVPFEPLSKKECITLDDGGRKCQVELSDRLSQITNEYIKGEERSFTIISYPIPEIGDKFEQIFSETVKLNTLDYKCYEKMQQLIIDVLDEADTVRIVGKGTNKTKLIVKTQKIADKSKQSSFENCVADVNIPVGEVFTSPVLRGTTGVLNVSEVYLFGLNYIDLMITFKDGMIVDYTCKNFDSEEENRKYIRENILHNHETLPMGEFAIGTNTTAYRMARDYHIEERLPILIGEKTGPHFAVGDTCYSHEEDVKVYNPDGKEIICRDNELTREYRKNNPSKAYFNCHTDITIPYDELGGIYAVKEDGTETAIIEDGIFVLEGLEELNKPLL